MTLEVMHAIGIFENGPAVHVDHHQSTPWYFERLAMARRDGRVFVAQRRLRARSSVTVDLRYTPYICDGQAVCADVWNWHRERSKKFQRWWATSNDSRVVVDHLRRLDVGDVANTILEACQRTRRPLIDRLCRPMTPEEQAELKAVMREALAQFIDRSV